MTNALTCIIVDDNYLDRLAVELAVKNIDNIKLLGSFANAMESLETIRNYRPDILFLDVDMPDVNGLQLFRNISCYAPICIIISSYPEYAVEGFELKVFDYILKPLTTERFDEAMKRLFDFIVIKEKAAAYTALIEDQKIVFKEGHDVVYLNMADILYLEAFGDYTKVVTVKKNYLTLATLSSFLIDLPCDKFTRIHRSYAVARSQISLISSNFVGIGGINLPIGKTYRSLLAQIRS